MTVDEVSLTRIHLGSDYLQKSVLLGLKGKFYVKELINSFR